MGEGKKSNEVMSFVGVFFGWFFFSLLPWAVKLSPLAAVPESTGSCRHPSLDL